MKPSRVFIWTSLGLLLVGLAALVLPAFRKARHYSGPGIRGNLILLQQVKMAWEADHPGGKEWPTKEDLNPYLAEYSSLKSIDDIRRRSSEIYIINKTGASVYAYYPKSGSPFKDSEVYQLGSDEMNRLKGYWADRPTGLSTNSR